MSKLFRLRVLRHPALVAALTIGLADGHQWKGGASQSKNGITCNPNIPTEEVFTTPHKDRVEGYVRSTKPLSHNGTLIADIEVKFEGGRIVEAKASKGEAVMTPPKSKMTCVYRDMAWLERRLTLTST